MLMITFATFREAAPTLRTLKAFPANEKNLFKFTRGYILITGIGILAATSQVALHLPLVDCVWNMGLAGSLQPDLAIGKLCQVQAVSKFSLLPEDIDLHSKEFNHTVFPSLQLANSGISLISSDFPIHHTRLRKKLGLQYHIVDMEGYGIAFAAKQSNKPCHLWKYISDFASPNGQNLIQKHIDELAEESAKMIIQELM